MRLRDYQNAFTDWLTTGASGPAARLGDGPGLLVYQRNYRTALMGLLGEVYRQTRAHLGETEFDALAARFIDASPPNSWTLDAYGEDFAESLPFPLARDLARLERRLSDLFVAADETPIAPADAAPDDWETARIRFTPGLSILEVETNADEIWSALSAEEPEPKTALSEGALILWRRDFVPRFRRSAAGEGELIARALRGDTFGALCAEAAAREGEEGLRRVGERLGLWLRDGMIAQIRSEAVSVVSGPEAAG
jgi:hypothetical protein